MFHLLATTNCKRQQIAILIISFFAYVTGIRNEGNNMLWQQQELLQQQQHTTIANSNNKRPIADSKRHTTLNFRPSQIIDFTPADAVLPQQLKPTYIGTPPSALNNNKAIEYNYNKHIHNNVSQEQDILSSNRRYAVATAATYGNAAEKPFSFPNEQQQIPQHLTVKPIYVYRDPFTNENHHYTPTETNVRETTMPTTYNHNNYNYDAYKQQHLHQHLQHYDDNQEYLVQSSMTVGTHNKQQQQQQLQQQQEINPLRPYMSLSADKDVYLKRPGFVYDEKPSHNLPNSVADKKSEVNKISYDSHDYPPPSYFQQQTSNFLPTPVPSKPPTAAPIVKPTPPPRSAPYQNVRSPQPPYSAIFVQQQPQQQHPQSSQSPLPNYANSIDNYLLNKQQTSEFYRPETPTPTPPPFSQQPQTPYQYESRPPLVEYDFPQQSPSTANEHKQQHFSRPPAFNSAQIPYRQYESARPPPGRPSYNNYYGYQIGEIPPQVAASSAPPQHFSYPYPGRPPYQGSYRPPAPPPINQQTGLATLAQYAPQFTSLLLGGVGSGGANSNNNGPLGSLIGALTGAATSQHSSAASFNRRPVNSQLIKALENIARNDDLQCVPKVLCQMIAAQTQRGQLPTFITSPAITNFLAGFPAASPALIYGRAALLGLSGGERSCHQTYVSCPKDEYEILYYLNNHRGGFFKFFSEPEEQQQTGNQGSTQQSATSLFSILSALAGAPQTTTTTPRPTPKPQAPATDITSGIGNFFTQLLSDYVGGATVEYQRRFKRRTKRAVDGKIKFEGQSGENHGDTLEFEDESLQSHRDVLKFKDQQQFDKNESNAQESEQDFHDEEDEEDTQHSFGFEGSERDYFDSSESRISHKNLEKGKRILFFPEMRRENLNELAIDGELKEKIKKYNDYNKERKLKFPTATDGRMYTEVLNDGTLYENQNYGHQFTNYVETSSDKFEKEKQQIKFTDYHGAQDNENRVQDFYTMNLQVHKNSNSNIIFPERDGKILNHFNYAASYLQAYPQGHQNQAAEAYQNAEFHLANDQASLHYTERPSPPSFSISNTYTNSDSLKTQNSIFPNKVSSTKINTNINHFLPTPPPSQDNEFSSFSNLINSNPNYSNNQHKQTPNFKYPSAGSSSASYINNNSVRRPITQSSFNRYHSSLYTTRRPYTSEASTEKSDSKNIYVTNSRGVTEYYITPDGRKIYL